jgi:hypothetical protein
MMAKLSPIRPTTLKAGVVLWLPCELTSGIFPSEQSVKIEVNVGELETVFGFIPRNDIRAGDNPNRGFVRAVVLNALNGKVALLFRGDILSHSNPVLIPREWLLKAGQVEA